MHAHPLHILKGPRITEKASYLAQDNCYVFDVTSAANKGSVAAAIRAVYKVTPRKVTVVRTPRKRVMTRGTNRAGQTASGKKAYVYLKKGDTIELS